MVVIGLGKNLLFKSVLANCGVLDQKSVNLKYITVGRLDDDMMVPPSDGAMFILID